MDAHAVFISIMDGKAAVAVSDKTLFSASGVDATMRGLFKVSLTSVPQILVAVLSSDRLLSGLTSLHKI